MYILCDITDNVFQGCLSGNVLCVSEQVSQCKSECVSNLGSHFFVLSVFFQHKVRWPGHSRF